MTLRAGVAMLLAFGVLGACLAAVFTPASPAGAAASPASLFVVQALPDEAVSVAVDGREVRGGVDVGGVLGPLELAPGRHDVELSATNGDWAVSTTVKVAAADATDLVLHKPAALSGDPVVSQYALPDRPIGPDKARVLLAHTATAPPADVRVDGQTVFTNIANGEFAQADLPAGRHDVALLPTGSDRNAFLGPLGVRLPSTTVTMVYAVGVPQDNSMRVITHRTDLAEDGSTAPRRIETGSSAGLVRDLLVSPLAPR